ncbi:hypothetical protein ACFYY1_41895 [Streptomyces sp. NPDC001890]|uniref:hypothetical protein n=1 Tax=Streptomyces sp. NPDC001890 TaxID=3364620 RepID=UPI0036CBBAA7
MPDAQTYSTGDRTRWAALLVAARVELARRSAAALARLTAHRPTVTPSTSHAPMGVPP